LGLPAVAHGDREQLVWATAARPNRRGPRRLESFNLFDTTLINLLEN
jgi:hypothetical protein